MFSSRHYANEKYLDVLLLSRLEKKKNMKINSASFSQFNSDLSTVSSIALQAACTWNCCLMTWHNVVSPSSLCSQADFISLEANWNNQKVLNAKQANVIELQSSYIMKRNAAHKIPSAQVIHH